MSDTTSPKDPFGLPYSPIRQAGDFYYISGHTGANLVEKSANPNLKAQTAQLFDNLAATLKSHELGFNDIIKTTIFLTDMTHFPAVNEVYATYFAEPRPARSTVAVRELPRIIPGADLKIEIEAVAYKQAP
jgi:2-iminobutanoate/2-iminopropanoate deaminase